MFSQQLISASSGLKNDRIAAHRTTALEVNLNRPAPGARRERASASAQGSKDAEDS